jgi:hypothetical protein
MEKFQVTWVGRELTRRDYKRIVAKLPRVKDFRHTSDSVEFRANRERGRVVALTLCHRIDRRFHKHAAKAFTIGPDGVRETLR